MELMIIPGTPGDIDELEELYDVLNDYLESHVNYPGWKKGVYPVREQAENGIQNGTLYVAKRDHKIVGSVILNHEPEQVYDLVQWKVEADYEEIYVVHTLAVHPDYLREGVGQALLDFADELAKRDHAKAIRLDVYEKNLPAIHAYEKAGYHYIGQVDLGLRKYGLEWFKLFEKVQ